MEIKSPTKSLLVLVIVITLNGKPMYVPLYTCTHTSTKDNIAFNYKSTVFIAFYYYFLCNNDKPIYTLLILSLNKINTAFNALSHVRMYYTHITATTYSVHQHS